MKLDKYRGIIPAFYACYDRAGEVSGDGVRALTRYFVDQGVKGVYVGGSSGECRRHCMRKALFVYIETNYSLAHCT